MTALLGKAVSASRLGRELQSVAGFRILHTDGGAHLSGLAAELPPSDFILIDVEMGRSKALALVRQLRHSAAGKAVVIGVEESWAALREFVEAGIAAYVPVGASMQEIQRTLRLTAAEQAACSPAIVFEMFKHLCRLARFEHSVSRIRSARLSPREIEVLLLIESSSNHEIARRLCLSVHTVKRHVHSILFKLQLSGRAVAAACIADAAAAGPEPDSSVCR